MPKIFTTLIAIVTTIFTINFESPEPETFKWPFANDESTAEIQIPTTKDCQLSYTQNNISFNYPCDWEVKSDENTIFIVYFDKTPPAKIIIVNLPAESFTEYENEHKNLIEADFMPMSIRENQLTINNATYTIKQYGEHGGSTYLLEIDGNYIAFGSEWELEQKDLASLYVILSSIKF